MASTTIETANLSFVKKSINNLKELFNSTYASLSPVKILENVGDHAFVIKFQPFEINNLKMTLQIPNDCALANSTLIITSKTHGLDKISTLKESLENTLKVAGDNDQVLVNFFNEAHSFIHTNLVKEGAQVVTPKPKSSSKAGEAKNTVNTKSNDKELKKSPKKSESDGEKKCSMKTAADVVNRIQWDEQINKDFITVGYLDRFVGIKECAFNTFDWGDIVLADLGALAIPEHRINYFKYKNVTVWDKNTRLDNIFGSTGSNQTIYDIIEQMKNLDFKPVVEEEEEVVKKPRKIFNQENEEKIGPNYFISIPVETSEIVRNLEALKNDLEENDPRVEELLVPETSHHLTLCTLYAGSRDELEVVKRVLNELAQDKAFMSEHLPVSVKFEGINDFFNKVLYVNCSSDEMDKLANIKRTIEDKLREAGVNMAGNHYDFVPHLTVLKISSKSSFKNLTVSQVLSRDIRKKYENFNFGAHIVKRIDLCKMVNIFDCKTYPVEHTIKSDIEGMQNS